jgi:hypothetical protein
MSMPGTHNDFHARDIRLTPEQQLRARTYVLAHADDDDDACRLVEMLGLDGEQHVRSSYSVRVAEQRERRRRKAAADRLATGIIRERQE